MLAGLDGRKMFSVVACLAHVSVKAWAWVLLEGHLGNGGHIVYTRPHRWGHWWTDPTCL